MSIQFSTNHKNFDPASGSEDLSRLNDYLKCLVVESMVLMSQKKEPKPKLVKATCAQQGLRYYESAYFASYDEEFYEKHPEWRGRIISRHRHNMARNSIIKAEQDLFKNFDDAVEFILREGKQ